MNHVTYSMSEVVSDLDTSLLGMKYDTFARKTRMAIKDLCRNTEEGMCAIIGTACAMGWIWGGFHWYYTGTK